MSEMRGVFNKTHLADGTAVVVSMAMAALPSSVWVRPAAGDTVVMSYSLDGGVNFTTGITATAYAEDKFIAGVTHVRFQRTAGAGTTSTAGVC